MGIRCPGTGSPLSRWALRWVVMPNPITLIAKKRSVYKTGDLIYAYATDVHDEKETVGGMPSRAVRHAGIRR